MTLRLRYAALSDVGRVRKDNQDSGFASENLLVIADGVGGAARGDVASSTAVHILRRLDAPAPDDMLEALAGAIHRAHDRIAELVDDDPDLEGTSTTVTAALFDGARIAVGHIGDSRGYLLRDGTLSQLTQDHTFVQSLIDEGRITEDEARVHPHRNLILRAVDGVHETDPDLFHVDLAPGDRILLCSDGCTGVLDNDRIADILGSGTVDFAVVELIRASLDAGSTDNITCVVADVVDPEAVDDQETVAATTTGPMLVGAAADQPRKAGATSKSFFRGHRGGDTGELEPVPGGDPQLVDPEELRYAPRPPRRFAWLRVLAVLTVVAVLATLGGMAAYNWTQDQYYVAADGETVAIYKGVDADLPGLTLTSVLEETDVTLDSLPAFHATQVRDGISAQDLGDARDIVSRLGDFARVCPTPTPTPTPTAKPTAKPTASSSPKASGSPTSTRTSKPAATPTDRDTSSPAPSRSASPSRSATPTKAPSPTLAPPDCVESKP